MNMKKLIFIGLVLAAVLAGWYLFVPQQTADNQPKRFSSAEELNAFINASSQAGFYGEGVPGMTAVAAQKSASQGATSGLLDYSQTNIQVAGVDEADIVKTDGKYIYAVSGSKVLILDAYPAENASIVSQIETNGTVGNIYINGDRLVIFGQENYQYLMPETTTGTGGTQAVKGVSDAPSALAEKAAVAREAASQPAIMRPYYYSPKTFIYVYDVSDKNNPVLSRNVSVGGSYYDSRMIGNYVYVIANQPVYNYGGPVPLPVISSNGVAKETPASDIYYFDFPDSSYVYTNILSLNAQDSGEPTSKTFLTGYAQSMYVSAGSIYIAYQKRVDISNYYDRLVDEAIIPNVPADLRGRINEVRNLNESRYEKMQEIGKIFEGYLATLNPEQAAAVMKSAEEKAAAVQADIAKETDKTVIHKISIGDGNIEYATNGEVPGQPLNQFSMDESNGYFRIATTTSGNIWYGGWGIVASGGVVSSGVATSGIAESPVSIQIASAGATQTGNETVKTAPGQTVSTPIAEPSNPGGPQNNLYVLDGSLKIAGKIENLAGGERIYSVRFLGDKAYMVTFRQVDPLFVIDLSAPTNPKVLGYLKANGVSDYLHPYDETHLIGVGRDASDEGRIKGMKLSLFDVSDFANPKEISKYIIGGRGTSSDALYDHKAFLFDSAKNLLVIPVSEYTYPNSTEENNGIWQQPNYWQGAYVFDVDLTNGITLKGKITHANNTDNSTYSYDWNSQIRRSLFIGDALYTVSQKMVKMNSLSDLSEINKIVLPAQQNIYPYRVY